MEKTTNQAIIRAVDLRNQGKTWANVTRTLKREGFTTSRGRAFNQGSLTSMISRAKREGLSTKGNVAPTTTLTQTALATDAPITSSAPKPSDIVTEKLVAAGQLGLSKGTHRIVVRELLGHSTV